MGCRCHGYDMRSYLPFCLCGRKTPPIPTATCHSLRLHWPKQCQKCIITPADVLHLYPDADVNILSKRALCKLRRSIIYNLNCYLYEITASIYLRNRINDFYRNGVCNISLLRAESTQLNCCACIHSLYEKPVYIAKEVYFTTVSPPNTVYFNSENISPCLIARPVCPSMCINHTMLRRGLSAACNTLWIY